MSRRQDDRPEHGQLDLLETAEARSLLDQLLADSKLYPKSADYKALLDFVVRLRNFAPFNAMLLQIQKPDLSYAASALDWLAADPRTDDIRGDLPGGWGMHLIDVNVAMGDIEQLVASQAEAYLG